MNDWDALLSAVVLAVLGALMLRLVTASAWRRHR